MNHPVRTVAVTVTLLLTSCSTQQDASVSTPQSSIVSTSPPSTTTAAPTTTTSVPAEVLDRDDDATLRRMLADLEVLLANGPREAGGEAERAAATFIQGKLETLGVHQRTESVPLPGKALSMNIWSSFGDGPATVLVGAHYDSVHLSPGADDNGSGTVGLLELARRLNEMPIEALTITIVFFGAEEVTLGHPRDDHHFGSRLRAATMAEQGNLPDWMISLDMVGEPFPVMAVTLTGTDDAAAEVILEAGEEVSIDVRKIDRGENSDHEPFAKLGVPSVFVWRPGDLDYHTDGDSHIDGETLLENLRLIAATLEILAGRG
ncbi:MAG: M20/M25/M40 family metallo-hydrolase [Acidobacteria bacterium]|nr:M20/M25/M40 family metallo-hydrolase [Acidobacteriota bacterium]